MNKLAEKQDIDVFFETNRLIVRKWHDEDVRSMVAGLNNQSVAKGFNIPLPYTEEDAKRYIQKTQDAKGKSIYYALEQKDSSQIIGGGGIYYKNHLFSIGIWIREADQGKRFGEEVLLGAADYVFDVLDQNRVYAFFHKWNESSSKLCKNCHFKLLAANDPIAKTISEDYYVVYYTKSQRDKNRLIKA